MSMPCSFDRVKQKKVTDFAAHHLTHIERWNQFEANIVPMPREHNEAAFDRYLAWLHQRARLRLRPAWTQQDIADVASDDEGDNEYDRATREGYQMQTAPVFARAVSSNIQLILFVTSLLN
jgi:hypothetical protein